MFRNLTLVAFLLLGGCAALNEGATDIRRPGDGTGWFVATGAAGRTTIGPSEPVLITIDQIFLMKFEETHFEPSRLPGQGLFQARGEIAVLVGVPTDTGPASFTSTDGHYLVYYSNDVTEGQFLNVRNQRVYGPSAVGSDRMEVEFLVLELDRSSTQEQALLKNLADLGKAYAGMGGPVGSVLTDLGTTLLGSQNDDVEMRHRFTFDLGARPDARFPLLPGFYVAVRQDRTERRETREDWTHRRTMFDWANICLDRETGQLYNFAPDTRTAGPGGLCASDRRLTPRDLFIGQSYVVFHIERGVTSSSQAMTTFAAFGTQLAAVSNPSVTAVNTAIDRVRADYVMDIRQRGVWTALGTLENAAATYGSLKQQASADLSLAGARDTARSALTRASVALHRALFEQAATMDLTPSAKDPYDQAVYSQQIERLTDFFGSLDWEPAREASRLSNSHTGSRFTEVFGSSAEFAARVQAEVDTE